jgi:hypothetical protein
MAKKAAQIKELSAITAKRVRISDQDSSAPGAPIVSPFSNSVLTEAISSQASGDEAITAVLESMLGKLSEEGDERSQMREFLNLMLDTDPTLKEEILAEITPSK